MLLQYGLKNLYIYIFHPGKSWSLMQDQHLFNNPITVQIIVNQTKGILLIFLQSVEGNWLAWPEIKLISLDLHSQPQ